MKNPIDKVSSLNLLGQGDPCGRVSLSEALKSWKRRIGFYSMFMAIPALAASSSQAAAAGGVEPESDAKAWPARLRQRVNSNCNTVGLLSRPDNYFLPHQKGRYDMLSDFAGRDDCPGNAIPNGTYTSTAPFTDTGDTTGANNTINQPRFIDYCYYAYNAAGPDHIYSFTLSGRGLNPQIQVTSGSVSYNPLIYVLDDRFGGACPTGTGNNPCSLAAVSGFGSGTTATIGREQIYQLPLNTPLFLVIDAERAGVAGPYTLRIQDVTLQPGPRRTRFDFDADAKADLSIFRPSDATWYTNRASGGFSATQFGLSTDREVPADYDGDGRTDIAVFRDGTWYWLNSSNGGFNSSSFGSAGDNPQPADFDGDGRAELAVFRQGTWYTFNLASNQLGGIQFGASGDVPVVGDYDGDGRSDYAVFRNGTWYMSQSLRGFVTLPFGLPGDRPVPADYDGDSITDLTVFRAGIWFVRHSRFDFVESFRFGLPDDILAPADYNGNNIAEAAVYRNGNWYIKFEYSDGRFFSTRRFGLSNDRPLPAAYLP